MTRRSVGPIETWGWGGRGGGGGGLSSRLRPHCGAVCL